MVGASVGFGVAQVKASGFPEVRAVSRAEVQLTNGREPPRPTRAPNSDRSAAAPAESLTPARRAARAALPITVSITGDGVYGAGFFIDANHVLTCLHVVERMKSIRLSMADGPEQAARIVDRDAALDLAVLETDVPRPAHAKLGSVGSVALGDPAFSMGAPRKMGFSLSSGIVSFVGRSYDGVLFVQTDIATNSGSSGGPVLDGEGRVIGVSSFILRDSQGLAFALPIDYAHQRFAKYFAERLDTSSFDAWKAERRTNATKLAAVPHSATQPPSD